jgi:hypothetical protein
MPEPDRVSYSSSHLFLKVATNKREIDMERAGESRAEERRIGERRVSKIAYDGIERRLDSTPW